MRTVSEAKNILTLYSEEKEVMKEEKHGLSMTINPSDKTTVLWI